MNSTLELPAWHKPYNQAPCAGTHWIRIKLPAAERERLLAAQQEWNETMSQRSGLAPLDQAKQRWRALRAKYNQSKDPKVLDELEELGDRGKLLEEKLRERLRAIKARARKIALQHNCAPIYANVFSLAAAVVLGRIKDTEEAEKQANEMLENYPWRPSELLAALANLATFLKTRATVYSDFQGDSLEPPAIALEMLWPAIVANSKGGK